MVNKLYLSSKLIDPVSNQSERVREPKGPLIELNPDFGIQKNCPFH